MITDTPHTKLTIKDIILGIVSFVGITIVSVLFTFFAYNRLLSIFKEYIEGYVAVTNIATLFESIQHLFTKMPELFYFVLLQGFCLSIAIMVSIANNA